MIPEKRNMSIFVNISRVQSPGSLFGQSLTFLLNMIFLN